MPHGYLKNNKDVSRKKARGGASFSNKKSQRGIEKEKNVDDISGVGDRVEEDGNKKSRGKQKNKSNMKFRQNRYTSVDDIEFSISSISIEKNPRPYSRRPDTLYPTSECMICFESQPIVQMSKKCAWHDGACFSCLRRLYIKNAQKDIKHFPIKCFHPQCRKQIHFQQLQKHNFFATSDEVIKHHKMTVQGKIKRNKRLCTVLCPECEMPRAIHGVPENDKILSCKQCGTRSIATPDYSTIAALGKIKEDKIGRNDGCARCPNCSILISKGDGCDDMFCPYCQFYFSWEDAVCEFNALPIAKPPANEIYLWW